MFAQPNRTDRRARLEPVESLERRDLAAITGLTAEAAIGPPPARRGGLQAVTITGTIRADAPVGTRANILLFDEAANGVPAVLPVTLTPRGDGTATYSVPLTLSTKVRPGDRDGRQFAVAISVQGRAGSATATTQFALGLPPGRADGLRAGGARG